MTDYTDPRIIKTHRAIRNAPIDVLQHKPFKDIAVQDILDAALVNRSTFYKYYSGKSSLASAMIAEFRQRYARKGCCTSSRRCGFARTGRHGRPVPPAAC